MRTFNSVRAALEKDMSDDLPIAKKRELILGQIADAAKSVNVAEKTGQGREVTLVAVSKQQADDKIADMLATGQRVFGENRVQEAQKRWSERFKTERSKIELRLIGPLQTNKAELAVDLFDVIETLDREKIAAKLAGLRQKGRKLPRLLVQVNTDEEPQKSGIIPRELIGFMDKLKTQYDLHPEGLMCIPPLAKDVGGQAVSPHFWLMQNLARELSLSTLSMGMSGDFETAVKMGATHIRLGTALFGPRLPRA